MAEDVDQELTYTALVQAYMQLGGPQHREASEQAACSVAQARRLWAYGAPQCGPEYIPIRVYFEENVTVVADAEALTPLERRARMLELVRAYKSKVQVNEVLIANTTTRIATGTLLSLIQLQTAGEQLAGEIAAHLNTQIEKIRMGADDAMSLSVMIAMLERVQKITRGAIDLGRAAMDIERLRASRPDDAVSADSMRTPAEARAAIERVNKILESAAAARTITEDELRGYGTLPTTESVVAPIATKDPA